MSEEKKEFIADEKELEEVSGGMLYNPIRSRRPIKFPRGSYYAKEGEAADAGVVGNGGVDNQ